MSYYAPPWMTPGIDLVIELTVAGAAVFVRLSQKRRLLEFPYLHI